jgi:hypothetical protein
MRQSSQSFFVFGTFNEFCLCKTVSLYRQVLKITYRQFHFGKTIFPFLVGRMDGCNLQLRIYVNLIA